MIGGVSAPPVRMPVVASGSARPLQTAVLGTMCPCGAGAGGGVQRCRGERAERASGVPRACAGERDAYPSSSERYPGLCGMPHARGPISSRSGYLAMRRQCRWKRMIVSEAYPVEWGESAASEYSAHHTRSRRDDRRGSAGPRGRAATLTSAASPACRRLGWLWLVGGACGRDRGRRHVLSIDHNSQHTVIFT